VLHIATVHHRTADWTEVQTRYLRQNISVPYRTWTSLEGIDPSYGAHFDRVIDSRGRHSDKLNHLAIEICHEASDEDLLMFLDGDSFPIADPMPLIADGLARAPLIAVRREENLGDLQPHPCFCVTTVRTWRTLPGDWSQGYRWINAEGQHISDTGANLLRTLELTKTPWVEVLRSNRKNLDVLFFAIYGDTIYHHGAGLRGLGRFTRFHVSLAPQPRPLSAMPIMHRLRRRKDWRERREWEDETREHLTRLSDAVFAKIEQGNPDWVAEFI
jgi:hypothetical protein